ncbi:MAG TPA: pyridoxamine 5'-phosphate oxidase family protein, partial [Candidatus Pacearchaeota archaeon]|nr:pyridoxamine 5'-phosphate oxidase family protein [Candidatus Pacearchaeota archaeon]
MELTEKQELFLQQNSLAVLATADLENQPRAIFVEINSVNKNELVITDNEMQLTKNNLLENAKVFVLAYGKNYNYCLKI